jgi:membrane protease YdiL (CAAX protease family)
VKDTNNNEFETLTRTQILGAMAVTALLLLVIAKVWQKIGSVNMLPLEFSFKAIVTGLIVAVAITVCSAIIYRIWPSYRRSADYYLKLVIKPLIWPDIIWLGLLPGLSEELLFRGVMLPAIGLNWLGVIVSSLAFGVLHFSGENQWPYVVWATVVGAVLGYLALMTGNLAIPIIAHVLTNLISGLLWKFGKNVGFTSS